MEELDLRPYEHGEVDKDLLGDGHSCVVPPTGLDYLTHEDSGGHWPVVCGVCVGCVLSACGVCIKCMCVYVYMYAYRCIYVKKASIAPSWHSPSSTTTTSSNTMKGVRVHGGHIEGGGGGGEESQGQGSLSAPNQGRGQGKETREVRGRGHYRGGEGATTGEVRRPLGGAITGEVRGGHYRRGEGGPL